jgi:hypothetical protein
MRLYALPFGDVWPSARPFPNVCFYQYIVFWWGTDGKLWVCSDKAFNSPSEDMENDGFLDFLGLRSLTIDPFIPIPIPHPRQTSGTAHVFLPSSLNKVGTVYPFPVSHPEEENPEQRWGELLLFFEDAIRIKSQDFLLRRVILEGASIADFERGLLPMLLNLDGGEGQLCLVGIDVEGRIRVFPLTFPGGNGAGTPRGRAADVRLITAPQLAVAISRMLTRFDSRDSPDATDTAVVFFADGSMAEVTSDAVVNQEFTIIEPSHGLSGRIIDIGAVNYSVDMAAVTDDLLLFRISLGQLQPGQLRTSWEPIAHAYGPIFRLCGPVVITHDGRTVLDVAHTRPQVIGRPEISVIGVFPNWPYGQLVLIDENGLLHIWDRGVHREPVVINPEQPIQLNSYDRLLF